MAAAAAVAAKITAVWRQNFQREIFRLDAALFRFPVVSFDTEFPGFFRNTPIDATDLTRYEDLKHNVDPLRLIQFGITVADASGNVGGTWEFNLRFDLSKDLFVSQSIQFLQNNGIDFDKLRRDGIDFDMFAQLLSRVVAKHRNLCWVTFHGLYDLSHTLRTVTNRPLPHSLAGFTSLLGIVFGDVVDIKYMARFCQGLRGGELGLAAIAKILNVERVGGAHQAGSDSLLTARVYTKMRMVYKIDGTLCVGCLYGVSARICKPIAVPNTNGRCFIPYFSTPAPFQRCIPPHCSGFMQAAPTFSHVRVSYLLLAPITKPSAPLLSLAPQSCLLTSKSSSCRFLCINFPVHVQLHKPNNFVDHFQPSASSLPPKCSIIAVSFATT